MWGDVERRLLDAATHEFIARGFAAASLERIARAARAGKSSLYERYPTKEQLFEAVVRRRVDATLEHALEVDPDRPLEPRLVEVGVSMLTHALDESTLAMMRMLIAVAGQMPELTHRADMIGWNAGVERVARAIAARDPSEDAIARARPAAERFVDTVFAPQQMRLLFGADRDHQVVSISDRVREGVAALQAGGWLDGWE